MSCKSAAQIDALLPQTQCGLCTYSGCLPYAEALANDTVEINLCPPGGVEGLVALAELLQKDATPFMEDMRQKAKSPSIAVIREAECIGCTKCIQACPVDAILGTGKQMHTVIADECTGCELCIAPCPVDCIDMVPAPAVDIKQKKTRADHFRKRYVARNQRLQQVDDVAQVTAEMDSKKAYIAAALLRAKNRKSSSL